MVLFRVPKCHLKEASLWISPSTSWDHRASTPRRSCQPLELTHDHLPLCHTSLVSHSGLYVGFSLPKVSSSGNPLWVLLTGHISMSLPSPQDTPRLPFSQNPTPISVEMIGLFYFIIAIGFILFFEMRPYCIALAGLELPM